MAESPPQPLDGTPVARVAVLGASGFAGALAARLAWTHPRLQLTAATARADAGARLDELFPRHRVPLRLTEPDLDRIAVEADIALVSYPHGAAAPTVAALRERGVRVVDLSADFRLADRRVYEQWYGSHGAPERISEAVYGLPELHRAEIADAGLVANPGCYPTAAILALTPLAELGIATAPIIDAKSGVSGAGRGGGDATHFVTVAENVVPYKVDGHRHEPEIAEQLHARGAIGPVAFQPHLVPLDQGELVTCYVRIAEGASAGAAELAGAMHARYRDEPFVEVVDAPPGMRDVRDTNLCRIALRVNERAGLIMVFAVIDNLWKGAAGQAIQNVNLMAGLPETEGLT